MTKPFNPLQAKEMLSVLKNTAKTLHSIATVVEKAPAKMLKLSAKATSLTHNDELIGKTLTKDIKSLARALERGEAQKVAARISKCQISVDKKLTRLENRIKRELKKGAALSKRVDNALSKIR